MQLSPPRSFLGLHSLSSSIICGLDGGTMGQRAKSGRAKTASQQDFRGMSGYSSMMDLTLPFSHGASLLRRVFSEGLLLLRLAVRLWTYLGVGWKWSMQLVRLVLYAMLLMPGFLQMIVFYLFSPRVQRSVVYGPKPRQRLDLYFPPNARPHSTYPVVIYVTGGAWTIGYKAWGALLARRLSAQGVLVACLDYRNFPQGDALDMLEDVNTGICWVLDNAARFGGDPEGVTLVGQSAGGHLAGLALLRQAEQAALGSPALGASPAWSPACLRSFVGVSGAFDLEALAEHLHRRGLYKNLFERIMSLDSGDDADGSGADCNGGGDCANGGGGDCGDCDHGGDCSRNCSGGGGGKVLPGDGQAGMAGANGANGADLSRFAGPGGVDPGLSIGLSFSGLGPGLGRRGSVGSVGTSHDASGCKGGARPAYGALSPLEAARRLPRAAAGMLPPVLLIHGTADKTVPAEGSARLCRALEAAGASGCRCELVAGKTHTAFLIEDPMRGGRDLLMDTVLGAVTGAGAAATGAAGSNGWGEEGMEEGGERHVYGTLCPGFLCDLAGWVCPF